MWFGEENKVHNFASRISKEFTCAQKRFYERQEGSFRLKFFWTSDLATLQHVCPDLITKKRFCPFCDESITNVFNSSQTRQRHCKHICNIDEVIICVMHMIERISEYLLIRSADMDNNRLIESRLRTLPNFTQFKILEKETRNLDDLTWSELYLSGRQCTTLLNNYKMVLAGCSQDVLNIWETWKDIVNIIVRDYVSLKQEDPALRQRKSEHEKQATKESNSELLFDGIIDKLYSLTNTFLNCVKLRFAACNRTSYYTHILHHHVPSMLENLMLRRQSLILFANQGFESSHCYDSFIGDRHLARSAKKECDDPKNFYNEILGNRRKLSLEDWMKWQDGYHLTQLFLYKMRVIVMSCEVENATWNRMLRRVRSKHRTEYWKANEDLECQYEYEFDFENSLDPNNPDEVEELNEVFDDSETEEDNDIQESSIQANIVTALHHNDNTADSERLREWQPNLHSRELPYTKAKNEDDLSHVCVEETNSFQTVMQSILADYDLHNTVPVASFMKLDQTHLINKTVSQKPLCSQNGSKSTSTRSQTYHTKENRKRKQNIIDESPSKKTRQDNSTETDTISEDYVVTIPFTVYNIKKDKYLNILMKGFKDGKFAQRIYSQEVSKNIKQYAH